MVLAIAEKKLFYGWKPFLKKLCGLGQERRRENRRAADVSYDM
jgi:hypothetical protein